MNRTKWDYNAIDGSVIEEVYHRYLPKGRGERDRQVRSAFCTALQLCGVRFVRLDDGRVNVFRTYAPDGNEYTPEQLHELKLWRDSMK